MKKIIKSSIAGVLAIQMSFLPVVSVECKAAPADPLKASYAPTRLSSPFYPADDDTSANTLIPVYGASRDTYFTDKSGNILMYVNVWGSVKRSGQLIAPEGSDIATVIALAGGPNEKANLFKVQLNRFKPERDGSESYVIDLHQYVNNGDRSVLMEIKPNDTIIVPESKNIEASHVLQALGIVATAVTAVILYNR